MRSRDLRVLRGQAAWVLRVGLLGVHGRPIYLDATPRLITFA